MRLGQTKVTALDDYRVHNLNTGLNYTTIQGAIDANETLNGHTILVDEGIYYENVVINKSLSLVGNGWERTIIDANATDVDAIEVVAYYVNVIGFSIMNGFAGIALDHVRYCNITRNNMATTSKQKVGIFSNGSSDNSVFENDIAYHLLAINLYQSTINTIGANNITGNDVAIYCSDSSRNIIIENRITDNFNSIVLASRAHENNITRNNIVDNGYDGMSLWDFSSNNSVIENNITANQRHGISVFQSFNNRIFGNNITANRNRGIILSDAAGNIISRNNLKSNEYGVSIASSSDNTISENNITNNDPGIRVAYSEYNRIYGNNITDNGCGIKVEEYSSDNRFYHNNFINNLKHVGFYENTHLLDDVWDDGYPSGGNYWSDYDGLDVNNGPCQNVTGSDGIGDSPYIIDKSNHDNYPLMYPFAPEMEEIRIAYRNLLFKYTEMNSTLYELITNVTETIKDLQDSIGNLTLNFNTTSASLQDQINLLNNAYVNINHSIAGLQERIDSLNSTIQTSINKQQEQTINIKNILYIFTATTAILIAITVYLVVRKPKPEE